MKDAVKWQWWKGGINISLDLDKYICFYSEQIYLLIWTNIFVPKRRIVVGGKYFQDHSLKAVTTCENSLRGEIKRIFNSDGLD